MTGLLNDLLDVEALEHGRREFLFERIDAAIPLRESVAAAAASAQQKAINLTADIEEGLPLVDVDATALRQIADNLLSNALKFSPRGSSVEIRLKRNGDFVRCEVQDGGPGIAAEETERIFAKYVRGSARPTEGEKSTGLGLSIVRQLAEAMNARVWCDPRKDGVRGGVFVFEIHAALAPNPALQTV
jgi:signal transduction histidine kinase